MEAVKFLLYHGKMCDYYGDGCDGCEAQHMDCELTTNEPEKLVAIVERWTKAHPEEAADATKPKQDEPCVKTMQNDLSGTFYQTLENYENRFATIKSVKDLEENCYRNFQIIENRHIETCKEIVRLKDRVAELEVALKSETVPAPKLKRTRKDVFLAAFPNAKLDVEGVPSCCPQNVDTGTSCKGRGCANCCAEYWLAEVEE